MKRNEIIKYCVFFVLFVFLFFAEDRIGIRAFAIAFFMALVYCKQNVLVLSPLYIGAAMIVSATVPTLVMAIAPCFVIALAYFVHYKLRIKMKLIFINIYTFVSQIPLIAFEINNIYQVVNTIIGILGAQVFIYCFVIIIYAVLVKRLKYRLTADEVMAGCVIITVFGMGLYTAEIAWYNAFYTFLAALLLLLLFVDKKGIIFCAIALGIGASLVAGNPFVLALATLYGLAVSCFNQKTQYFAAIALIALDIIFRAFFDSAQPFSYYGIIAPSIGVLIVCLIPNKIKDRLLVFSVCFKERQGSRSLINRERRMIANRLDMLSGVFYEIQDILYIENREKQESADIEHLSKEIATRCCQNCVGLKGCRDALGGASTDMMLGSLVMAAIDNGRATILDTPPFLSSRCRKINGIINTVNDLTESFKRDEESKESLNEGRVMISEQMGGVGNILTELKRELDKSLSYDTLTEDKLIEELNANNIAASEAVVYTNERKDASLTLVVKESDSAKTLILDIINSVLGYPMEVVSSEKLVKGMVTLHYERAPKFKVVYGDRKIAKEEGEPSGDSHSATRITNNKVMLILSDGMGSGKNAGRNSGYAISLIESFYRAGFDHSTIVNTAGKLLSLRHTEEFNAVDIAVIDTANGSVDFIKMGGRESFVVNQGSVEVIECGSLPIGILSDDLKPIVEKRNLQSGSFVVMVSDGVIDIMGKEALIELLSETHTTNPDTMAQQIMSDLERLMKESNLIKKDDCCIVVAKIYAPIAMG